MLDNVKQIKICSKCREIRSYCEFSKGLGNPDGYQYQCKECDKKYSKIRSEIRKQRSEQNKINNKNKPIPVGGKICSKCQYIQSYNDFCKDSTCPSGYASQCKTCMKQKRMDTEEARKPYYRQYYKENKEEIRASQILYDSQHKEEKSQYGKKYRQNNKEDILKKQQLRLKNDILYLIARNLRSRMKMAIKGNYKSGSAVRDLGCTIPELKQRLESKFYPNPIAGEMMTWENWGAGYGKWQLDHKDPLCHFDLSNREEFLRAAHYTNLQPLWYEDHIKKTAQDCNLKRKIG